jgi:uncharacterized damage-inducible protein DinB
VISELVEAWQTNHRMNMQLIEHVSDEGLDCTLSKRGGRGVRGELAHMHTNRVWQLQKRAKDLAEGLPIYTAKDMPSRAQLAKAHKNSTKAIEQLLIDASEGKPKRRVFKKGLITTLSYFIAHESHHRGRILLTLKVSGHTLDKDPTYALWAWDQS